MVGHPLADLREAVLQGRVRRASPRVDLDDDADWLLPSEPRT